MPWFPISEVSELVRPATGTRRRLPAEAELGGQLDRPDVVRRRGAEDVAAGTPTPGDRPVTCREAPRRKRLDDAAAGRLDTKRDARRAGQLEAARKATMACARREEPERVVETELTIRGRMTPEIVVGDRPESPGALGLACAGPVELVETWTFRPGVEGHDDAAGTEQRRGNGGRTHELVRKDLGVVDAVGVRREHARRQRRLVHAVVEERQRLGARALTTGVGRPVEQLAVERHRRRTAGVERGSGDATETHHRQRELEIGQ